MHVERIGFAPLKGTRHLEHTEAHLAVTGPVGDRELCLVDLERERVLRTVEHPPLVEVVASRAADHLRLDLPGGAVEAPVVTSGDPVKVDYWGRLAELELVDGPFSDALSDHLGQPVRLARLLHPGDIVYGGSVSLVGTGALSALAERVGHQVDSARFRSTLLVDTGAAAPHVEDDWIGSEVSVGEAVLLVTAVVARCAVIDIDPVSGARDQPVLATLAGYRRAASEVVFGVDAEVVRPGPVRTGDPVVWEGS